MTAAVARLSLVDTLPEANAWYQPLKQGTRGIDLNAGDLTSRIQGTLFAEQYRRAPGETGQDVPSVDDTKFSQDRTPAIMRQINIAVSSSFPWTAAAPTLSLQALQEWEGYVTSIDEGTFSGCLVDVTARQRREDEVADFPISDLSNGDRELLKLGAVFRWVIGYQRSHGGTKRRVSQITFRRMPAWSRKDLVEANEIAAKFAREIPWE
jgi:hypothetical protein